MNAAAMCFPMPEAPAVTRTLRDIGYLQSPRVPLPTAVATGSIPIEMRHVILHPAPWRDNALRCVGTKIDCGNWTSADQLDVRACNARWRPHLRSSGERRD